MDILTEIYDQVPDAVHYEGYIAMFCPWHYGHRRSLLAYPDYFICLSCDEKGNLKKLLQKVSNGIIVPRTEVETFINPWNDWLFIEGIHAVTETAHEQLLENPNYQKYWKSRGIPTKTIKKLKLGWREGYGLIPITGRDGKVIGGVARDTREDSLAKYVTPNRKYQSNSDLLYVPSWKRLDKQDKVYMAFGIISAISLYLCGVAACSPLTGKKVNPNILKDIRKQIIIIPDKNEEKEAIKLANQLGWRGKTLLLPYHDNIRDPNDMWINDKNTMRGILNGD